MVHNGGNGFINQFGFNSHKTDTTLPNTLINYYINNILLLKIIL